MTGAVEEEAALLVEADEAALVEVEVEVEVVAAGCGWAG
jgi:hypothetical protein